MFSSGDFRASIRAVASSCGGIAKSVSKIIFCADALFASGPAAQTAPGSKNARRRRRLRTVKLRRRMVYPVVSAACIVARAIQVKLHELAATVQSGDVTATLNRPGISKGIHEFFLIDKN